MTIPMQDVLLEDGRRLRYAGQHTVDVEGTVCHMSIFFGPKGLKVFVSRDATKHGDLLHVSVSYQDGRWPSWRDLREVKQAFYGDERDAMMVLPKARDYVNVSTGCFHLWETPVGWDVQ